MKHLFITLLMLGGFSMSAFASGDCTLEKQVAVAWIQGHLSIENDAFENNFKFDNCTDEGYTEVIAVIFKSSSTICAIDVDPKAEIVVPGNRGCYPLQN